MFKQLFGSGKRSSLVEAAFEDVSRMLQQSAKMLDLSLAALLENKSLDADLENMDDVVDEGERMVRRTILEHLSVNPAQDLVASLILVSMVQDAERIGDFARGMGELVTLAGSPREGVHADELRSLATRLKPMFEMSETAFREDDSELAQRVVNEHVELKQELIEYTSRVARSDLSADMAIVYATAARILRRISAHLSNIVSSVIQPYDRIRHGDEDL
jgi:phosphate transport system protein